MTCQAKEKEIKKVQIQRDTTVYISVYITRFVYYKRPLYLIL